MVGPFAISSLSTLLGQTHKLILSEHHWRRQKKLKN